MRVFRFCCVLLIFLSSWRASADETLIWVAIQVEEGQQRIVEYYGQVSTEVFEAILTQNAPAAFFKMRSVFWYDEAGRAIKLSYAKNHSLPYGYMDDAYFRYEQVDRLIPLDESVVLGNFERKPVDINDYAVPQVSWCDIKACLHKWLP